MSDTSHKQSQIKSNWLMPIVTSIITAVIVSFANYHFTLDAFQKQSLWTQKRDAYIRALKVVNRIIRSSPNDVGKKIDYSISPTPEEINDSYVELATFSNREILEAFNKCLANNSHSLNGTRNNLIDLMRKDLGIDPNKLADEDLMFDYGLDTTEVQKASQAGFH
jgi:hypothetical protein